MTRRMHMPVMRLHVHNGGDSKISMLQKAPPCLNLPVLPIERSEED